MSSHMSSMTSMNATFTDALLVEDEPNLATTLKVALTKIGISVSHVTTLEEADKYVRENSPSLILLDRALPDGDGLSLCRRLRSQASSFQGMIVMLTARGELTDRVSGLNAGADDYLTKPFSWQELEARIRALFRRSSPDADKKSEDQLWHRDESKLRILGPNGWITLTPLEYKLACKLIDAQGAIVTREDLLKDVWGFTLLPKTRTVDHFLGRLRKYFEQNADEPKHFITVRGAGYRFEV
jgi:two-component system alkaline phosphatase synthesis response regulator PhoP